MGVKEGTPMSLNQMKAELHDRLWNAQQRWFAMRGDGWTKHEVKMAGVREFQDQNHFMRPILFAGRSRVTYERVLKSFLEFAHARFDVQRLDYIDTKHAKAFLDDAIARGLAAKTLQRMSSALVKAGCLIGRSASFIAMGERYARKIRELVAAGEIVGPARATPSPEVVRRAIEFLRVWDARHFERTEEPRAYHLVAQLQVETSCRSISATARVTADSLLEGHRIALSAKGGRMEGYVLSPELHRLLSVYLRICAIATVCRDYCRDGVRAVVLQKGPLIL